MRSTTHFRQFRVTAPSPFEYEPLGAAVVAAFNDGFVRLNVGKTAVEVTALAPGIFRVGMFDAARPPRYRTEAISSQDWPEHSTHMTLDPEQVTVRTDCMTAEIQLNPLRLSFGDLDGRRFAMDDPALGMGFAPFVSDGERVIDPLGPPARVYKRHPAGERYFGCGERTGGLEKTDSHLVFWNADPGANYTPGSNNLYTSIPFFLAVESGRAWGMFLDNPGYVELDLAHEHPEHTWFGSDTGDLVYYVFAGPTPAEVVDRYTQLTGRTPMPPLWALGYHASRWGRKTAAEVMAVAQELRRRDMPCDALYLDIDYMDGFRVFTWDPERFPDPSQLARDLDELGIRLVTIVNPGVMREESYRVYREGHDAGFFIRNPRGAEYQNVVWPGICAFPDFTSASVREWWGDQLPALTDHGVAGIWCDMNEPTMFIPTPLTLPPDAVHSGDDEPTLHASVHNLYGSLMAQATRAGLLRHQPDRRPFVISRAGYAGLQRHALHWTGDNSSWWEHLWMATPQIQNLGMSGLAWVGVDVGGFGGDTTGELLTRWMELGAFLPFCRNHSSRYNRAQEPWSFGEPYESAIRSMLKLRQRLLPYLYSLFDFCNRTGAPIIRPLFFEFADDAQAFAAEDELLVGRGLLVAPIANAGATYRHVYLPRGEWFHFWTDERIQGPAHVLAHAPLGQPLMYLRGGYPLPLWPEMLHVGERAADPLTLVLYPSEDGGSLTLYEDAGDGFEHERGEYLRTVIESTLVGGHLTVRASQEGAYRPTRERIQLELRRWPSEPVSARLNGADHSACRYVGGTVFVDLPPEPSWVLEVRHG